MCIRRASNLEVCTLIELCKPLQPMIKCLFPDPISAAGVPADDERGPGYATSLAVFINR